MNILSGHALEHLCVVVMLVLLCKNVPKVNACESETHLRTGDMGAPLAGSSRRDCHNIMLCQPSAASTF